MERPYQHAPLPDRNNTSSVLQVSTDSVPQLSGSRLWADALGMPQTLREVIERFGAPGGESAVGIARGARRLVPTGNGAAFYSALALESAARSAPSPAMDVVAVPAGIIAAGGFTWREGDVPIIFSTSGELRDLVAAVHARRMPEEWIAITATPDSTLGSAATARVDVPVRSQVAVTHTQSYVANVLTGYLLWQAVAERPLDVDTATLADRMDTELAVASAWAPTVLGDIGNRRTGIAFAAGAGWSAALQTALVFKEVAGLTIEGLEAREAATTGMYALDAESLVLSHAREDLGTEAERICGGRGAAVLRLPLGEATALELPILGFPAALALSSALGIARGRNIDKPDWVDAYYGTART
jgi:fructoselysine-6-P-deglycase FrlB-like protein